MSSRGGGRTRVGKKGGNVERRTYRRLYMKILFLDPARTFSKKIFQSSFEKELETWKRFPNGRGGMEWNGSNGTFATRYILEKSNYNGINYTLANI